MTNHWNGASFFSKITAGVLVGCILASIAFGMNLYAGQQDPFTGKDGEELRAEVLEYVDQKYTRTEVIVIQNQAILARLERLEKKLDEALRER